MKEKGQYCALKLKKKKMCTAIQNTEKKNGCVFAWIEIKNESFRLAYFQRWMNLLSSAPETAIPSLFHRAV